MFLSVQDNSDFEINEQAVSELFLLRNNLSSECPIYSSKRTILLLASLSELVGESFCSIS